MAISIKIDQILQAIENTKGVGLLVLTSDPTEVPEKGFIYSKDVGGYVELFFMDSEGNATQLSNRGTPVGGIANLDAYAPKTLLDSYALDSDLDLFVEKTLLDSYAALDVVDGYALETDLDLYALKTLLDSYALAGETGGVSFADIDGYAEKILLDSYATLDVVDGYALESSLSAYAEKSLLDSYLTLGDLSDGYISFSADELSPDATDGSETQMTLDFVPADAYALSVYRNGLLMRPVSTLTDSYQEYTLADDTVTFLASNESGNWYFARYIDGYNVSSSGGGSSGALWTPPSSPHAYDVEFDGPSLPANWVESYTPSASAIDPYAAFASGDTRRDFQNSWMRIQPPADSTVRFIHRAITIPTNMFVWVRLRSGHRESGVTNNDGSIGIGFYETSTGAPDRENSVELWRPEANPLDYSSWAAYQIGGAGFQEAGRTADRDGGRGLFYEYAGIHKIGTTYHYWLFSDAGQFFYMGNSGAHAITPDRISIMTSSSSTAAPGNIIMGCDFIRFVESATFLPG